LESLFLCSPKTSLTITSDPRFFPNLPSYRLCSGNCWRSGRHSRSSGRGSQGGGNGDENENVIVRERGGASGTTSASSPRSVNSRRQDRQLRSLEKAIIKTRRGPPFTQLARTRSLEPDTTMAPNIFPQFKPYLTLPGIEPIPFLLTHPLLPPTGETEITSMSSPTTPLSTLTHGVATTQLPTKTPEIYNVNETEKTYLFDSVSPPQAFGMVLMGAVIGLIFFYLTYIPTRQAGLRWVARRERAARAARRQMVESEASMSRDRVDDGRRWWIWWGRADQGEWGGRDGSRGGQESLHLV
jgi:hypothetical protein